MNLEEMIKRQEERLKLKKLKEEKEAAEEAEKQRQAYLKRTGRTEMKP